MLRTQQLPAPWLAHLPSQESIPSSTPANRSLSLDMELSDLPGMVIQAMRCYLIEPLSTAPSATLLLMACAFGLIVTLVLLWKSRSALVPRARTLAHAWSVADGQGIRDVLDDPDNGHAPPAPGEELVEALQTQRFGHFWRNLVFWAKNEFDCKPAADTPAQRQVVRLAIMRKARETVGLRERHLAMHLDRCVVLAFTPSVHEVASKMMDQGALVQERREVFRRNFLREALSSWGLIPR